MGQNGAKRGRKSGNKNTAIDVGVVVISGGWLGVHGGPQGVHRGSLGGSGGPGCAVVLPQPGPHVVGFPCRFVSQSGAALPMEKENHLPNPVTISSQQNKQWLSCCFSFSK